MQRVADTDLAEFIAKCISPRAERPRARNLLKHPYFDSMRQEKCLLKLSADALAADGRSTADLVAEVAGSAVSSSVSRSSSTAGSSAAGGAAALQLTGWIWLHCATTLLLMYVWHMLQLQTGESEKRFNA